MDAYADRREATSLTHRQTLLIVLGVLLPTFMGSLDQTILATALPTIGRDFGEENGLAGFARQLDHVWPHQCRQVSTRSDAFETRMPPASPVSPPSPRLVAMLMCSVLLEWTADT